MTADDGMTRPMLCYSCRHYTVAQCLKSHTGWPNRELLRCQDGIFDPGTGPVEFGSYDEYLKAARAIPYDPARQE